MGNVFDIPMLDSMQKNRNLLSPQALAPGPNLIQAMIFSGRAHQLLGQVAANLPRRRGSRGTGPRTAAMTWQKAGDSSKLSLWISSTLSDLIGCWCSAITHWVGSLCYEPFGHGIPFCCLRCRCKAALGYKTRLVFVMGTAQNDQPLHEAIQRGKCLEAHWLPFVQA